MRIFLILLVGSFLVGCAPKEEPAVEAKGEKPPIVQPDQSALDRRGAAEKGE